MGSLMPGWDTPSQDLRKVMKRSKTSLTKEEIEAFWRHKQHEIEAHNKDINAQNANALPPNPPDSNDSQSTDISSDGRERQETVLDWQQPTASSRDWWTRSSWAYLNAPPECDDPGQYRHRPYLPQYDVGRTRYNSLHAASSPHLRYSAVS